MSATERILAEARKFSPGISAWIDAQLALGCSPENVISVLQATTRLVKAEQELSKASEEFRKAAP